MDHSQTIASPEAGIASCKALFNWSVQQSAEASVALYSLGNRWITGDVSPRGFKALRLSIWGAWRLFGAKATYAVCVTLFLLNKPRCAPEVPAGIAWHGATGDDEPDFLNTFLDGDMAEGVAWKFAPLRLFPNRWLIVSFL